MALCTVTHNMAKMPLFGQVEILADGTSGRQMLGWQQKRRVIITWATVAEAKAEIISKFPGGVGDYQLDGDPEFIPVVDQITDLVSVIATGVKITRT